MHGTKGMLKTGMKGAWVYVIGKPKLLNVTKALKVRMRDNIEDEFPGNGDKSVNRVVDDLLFVQELLSVNGYQLIGPKVCMNG